MIGCEEVGSSQLAVGNRELECITTCFPEKQYQFQNSIHA